MVNNSRFARFALVGVLGFIVDAGILILLVDSLGPYFGRVISFALAVFTTWRLNRSFTFEAGKNGLSQWGEFTRYFSAMIVGGIANYAVYAVLVFFVSLVAQWPVIGVAAGSVVGLIFNFTLAKNWIFKSPGK